MNKILVAGTGKLSGVMSYTENIANSVKDIKIAYLGFNRNYDKDYTPNSFVYLGKKLPFSSTSEIFNRMLYSYSFKQFIKSLDKNTLYHFNNVFIYASIINKKIPPQHTIVTIHDLMALGEYHADTSSRLHRMLYRNSLNAAMKNNVRILTVSQTVKQELIDYGFKEDNIIVIYPNVRPDFKFLNMPKYDKDIKTILSVSKNTKNKNLETVYEVMRKLGDSYKLIRVGDTPDYFNDLKNITVYKNLNSTTLNEIYNQSEVLFQPSLTEGFGIPIVEAFATGLPVVASNIRVFREIIGDGALMNDPNDIDGFVKSIIKTIENKKYYQQKVLERSKLFSFEKFKENINQYYNQIESYLSRFSE